MADLSINFHALPSELVPLVQHCVTEMNLHVIATTFPPWAARRIFPEDIPRTILDGPCEWLLFSETEPLLHVMSETELAAKNPGLLSLLVGRQTPKGLEQSWLACRTVAGVSVSIKWREIASRLRSFTEAGIRVLNPRTGATAHYKNHRYTAGAKALSDLGVPILPIAGTTIMKLGMT
jgi:hypothetical protein